jgi:hypothetical protein
MLRLKGNPGVLLTILYSYSGPGWRLCRRHVGRDAADTRSRAGHAADPGQSAGDQRQRAQLAQVRPGGTVHYQRVQVSRGLGTEVEIRSGLRGGETQGPLPRRADEL